MVGGLFGTASVEGLVVQCHFCCVARTMMREDNDGA